MNRRNWFKVACGFISGLFIKPAISKEKYKKILPPIEYTLQLMQNDPSRYKQIWIRNNKENQDLFIKSYFWNIRKGDTFKDNDSCTQFWAISDAYYIGNGNWGVSIHI